MPMRGPVLLSFLYGPICVHDCPSELVTVNLSVPFDDSRTNATSKSPGWVVTGTENEVNAAPLVSMLFWTWTTVGPPVADTPVPARLASMLFALVSTCTYATRPPAAVGLNVALIVQLDPAARLEGQSLVSAKSPLFVPRIVMLEMV